MTEKPFLPYGTARPEELGIIFSSLDGYVWASWPGMNRSIRLGPHEVVAAMMQDFLAQDALGERLRATQTSPPGDFAI